MKLYHAMWERTERGRVTCEARNEGGGGDAGEEGIRDKPVTKPMGNHARQNLKNGGTKRPATAK
jgi:hypothetical protein